MTCSRERSGHTRTEEGIMHSPLVLYAYATTRIPDLAFRKHATLHDLARASHDSRHTGPLFSLLVLALGLILDGDDSASLFDLAELSAELLEPVAKRLPGARIARDIPDLHGRLAARSGECQRCVRVRGPASGEDLAQSQVARSHEADLSRSALDAFRLFVRDVPDLERLVHAARDDAAPDVRVDIQRRGCVVVSRQSELGLGRRKDVTRLGRGQRSGVVRQDEAVLQRDLIRLDGSHSLTRTFWGCY